ncbi:MAG TPA: PEGA domain-containing protein [Polyangiaceae bacterium]|nr:PEGA domain-containing protein [Polyangiaceae bacterium]
MSVRRVVRIALLSICVLGTPSVVHADQASEAELQFELGTELYKQGHYAEAIERFIASDRLVPNANVVLNIAKTFAFIKRPLDAYNWYETYLGFNLSSEQRRTGEAERDALTHEVSVVEVSTEPTGADLFIDRADLGAVCKSPCRVAVEAGDRRVLARRDGYREATSPVIAVRGQKESAALVLVPILGHLSVTSRPPGALVHAESGQDLGVTPLELDLPVGPLRVVVSLAGFGNETRSVDINDGTRSVLDVNLERSRATSAVLSVKGNTAHAAVLLDGQSVGFAPLTVPNAPPGPHTLKIEAPNREPWASPVLLEFGAATRVDYDLIDPRTRHWPGWRWVGYGVGAALLAAGGVTGAIAVGEKQSFDTEPTSAKKAMVETKNHVADALFAAGIVAVGVTLTWDLLTGPAPASSGKVTVAR